MSFIPDVCSRANASRPSGGWPTCWASAAPMCVRRFRNSNFTASSRPQSGTVVAQEKMQVLERMITDALQIRQYDFASLVYVRVLLEIEAIKLCARNRTAEDLENIERALEECEAKFYTEERVSKDFAYHQALARGAHNPVIASMLLVITPDVLRYYQRYRVCTVPQEEVYFEHRELLRCVREKDEEGAVAMQRRHLKSLSEFAAAFNDENHFLE